MTGGEGKEGLDGVKLTPPYEVRLSKDVRARYGFKDGHVELEVEVRVVPGPLGKLMKPFTFRQRFPLEELRALKPAVDSAVEFGNLPEEDRRRIGAE